MCGRTRAGLAARISPLPAARSIRFFLNTRKALAQAGGASASYKIVPGSDHFYHGHESEVSGILANWLKQFSI